MRPENSTIHFKTIAQLHRELGLVKPKHPLFSIIRFEDFPKLENEQRLKVFSDFYQIILKKESPCRIQYGQSIFDFNEGIISCSAPKQVYLIDKDFSFATSGWQLSIHPDFLKTYPLDKKIKSFGFFDYAINEALILSEEEQKSIETIFAQIENEYNSPIDDLSQDVFIASFELLLNYCNRYYKRQFITRKLKNNEFLVKIEQILNSYYENEIIQGQPSVGYLALQLNLSPKYLSDALKQLTGHTAKQLIHDKIIDLAKTSLTTTNSSVSEIAYELGFDYPQSFSKLFKRKTNLTPREFRKNFN